jgi:Zn-dependent peptidase ImmA (M78 family)
MALSMTATSAFRTFAERFAAPSAESAMVLATQQILATHEVTLPFSLQSLFPTLGVDKVVPYTRLSPSLTTLRQGANGYEIHLGKQDSRLWRRQRFTVAHELGHLILMQTLDERHLQAIHKSVDAYQHMERLCDIAARELLMPHTLFQQRLVAGGLTTENLRALYDTFFVSHSAMLLRIAEVIPNSAIFLWKSYASTPHAEIAVRLYQAYPYAKGILPTLPRHCRSHHLSPNIITAALTTRTSIAADTLHIKTGHSRKMRCVGIATPYFSTAEATPLPMFEGFDIPDEPPTSFFEAVSLMMPQEKAADSTLWGDLRAQATLYS